MPLGASTGLGATAVTVAVTVAVRVPAACDRDGLDAVAVKTHTPTAEGRAPAGTVSCGPAAAKVAA